jgi:type IV pilus assembly protein PilA
MRNLPTQRRSDDKGFTLIELMVVVLIIAILLAIAIPTFLGAQNKAKDRSAQSSARNALTNAKTLYADNGTYIDATDVNLKTSEPSLTFVDATAGSTKFSDGAKVVSVIFADKDTWYAAVLSDTKTCFYIRDSVLAANQGTTYSKTANTATGGCAATATPGTAYSPTGW